MTEIASATLQVTVSHIRNSMVQYLTEHTFPELKNAVESACKAALAQDQLEKIITEQAKSVLTDVIRNMIHELMYKGDIPLLITKLTRKKILDAISETMKEQIEG